MASTVLAAGLATGGCGGGASPATTAATTGSGASTATGSGGKTSSSASATSKTSTTGAGGSGGMDGSGGAEGSGSTSGAGGAVTAAKPVALASNVAGAVGLFVDGTTVYWSETGAGTGQGAIKSVPKGSAGSASPTTIASGLTGPQGIWVDGGYVYWADQDGQYGSIDRAPTGGGAVELISSSSDNATEVVVADGALYSNWIAEGVIARLATSAITGASIVPPVFAATAPATHLTTDGANLIWVEQGMNSQSNQPTNSIVFAPLGTTATRSFLYNTVDNHTIDAISCDATTVYFTEFDGANVTVSSIALTVGNGSTTTIATLSGTDSQGIGSDGANVFYTELAGGKVVSSANEPTAVTGQSKPSRIVVEAHAIYWIDSATSGGSVMKLAR